MWQGRSGLLLSPLRYKDMVRLEALRTGGDALGLMASGELIWAPNDTDDCIRDPAGPQQMSWGFQ